MSAQRQFNEHSQLEAFRFAVWGNKSIFKKEIVHNSHTIEYLDFAEHHNAVRTLCPTAFKDRLVVFEEYRVAMRNFKEEGVIYKNGACIIGQPGIGTSCFIAYAVIERLREELPVAVQVSRDECRGQYFLFTSNAVTIHISSEIGPLAENSRVWAFSDSNDAHIQPSLAFLNSLPDIRVFQTNSPAKQRWKEWTKQHNINQYIMDVPSLEEIEELAIILEKDVQRIRTLAEKWGNVPRVLLWLLAVPAREVDLEQTVIDAVDEATEHFEMVFAAITTRNRSRVPGSSIVFFIKPDSKTNHVVPSIYVPTRWLTQQVVDGLCRHEDKRAGLFGITNGRPFSSRS